MAQINLKDMGEDGLKEIYKLYEKYKLHDEIMPDGEIIVCLDLANLPKGISVDDFVKEWQKAQRGIMLQDTCNIMAS